MATLKEYLTDEEYKYMDGLEFGKMNIVKNFVEQKILRVLYNIVNGKTVLGILWIMQYIHSMLGDLVAVIPNCSSHVDIRLL